MTLPTKTKEIFDTLRDGNFITIDNPDKSVQELYYTIAENFNILLDYFLPLGYELFAGDGYYIFYVESAINDKVIIDRLNRLEETMRLIDLFRGVIGDFMVGMKFLPSDLETGVRANMVYQGRLLKLESVKKQDSISEACRAVFKEMRDRSILARTADDMDMHYVTSAYNYVQEFIEAIERIGDEDEEYDNE